MNSNRSGLAARLFPAGLVAVLVGFGLYFDHAASFGARPEESVAALDGALARESASPDVRQVAQWAVATQDHAGLPFVVIDKARARIFAFDPQGRLRGNAPVLLGAARGDEDAAPATPAGRFVADTLASARSGAIIWVNADTQVALYVLPSPQAPGRGLQRLASAHVNDRRISEGSLHVAADFYRECLEALQSQPSIAYVLPETVPVDDMFGRARPNPLALISQRPRMYAARRPS
jgi:hypothetical protein